MSMYLLFTRCKTLRLSLLIKALFVIGVLPVIVICRLLRLTTTFFILLLLRTVLVGTGSFVISAHLTFLRGGCFAIFIVTAAASNALTIATITICIPLTIVICITVVLVRVISTVDVTRITYTSAIPVDRVAWITSLAA